ncbi:complement C1q subcomponent subunit B-like [Saccostrea cucullata]|uniref:complement C1q subcomponent subunit B-like n=1 Tax=Saccostrea cuccullata TaxID=36930 RepID=UPI002ED3330B
MLVDFKNNGPKRRAVTGGAAFYSYLSDSESNPNRLQIIIFDHVITNVGGNYNHHMGFFYSPMDGVYTFSWTLYCSSSGYIYSEIVVNSDAVGAMLCNGEGASSIRHSTGVVVVQVNQGDAVYIRTHPSANLIGRIHSYSAYRSSFSGWNLF